MRALSILITAAKRTTRSETSAINYATHRSKTAVTLTVAVVLRPFLAARRAICNTQLAEPQTQFSKKNSLSLWIALLLAQWASLTPPFDAFDIWVGNLNFAMQEQF